MKNSLRSSKARQQASIIPQGLHFINRMLQLTVESEAQHLTHGAQPSFEARPFPVRRQDVTLPSTQVSSLRDLGEVVGRRYRRLKPTVNKVSSLRDYAAAIPACRHCKGETRSNRSTECKLSEANPHTYCCSHPSSSGLLRKLAMTTSERCNLIIPQGLHFINRMLQLTVESEAQHLTHGAQPSFGARPSPVRRQDVNLFTQQMK
jgi:hypothetical protein